MSTASNEATAVATTEQRAPLTIKTFEQRLISQRSEFEKMLAGRMDPDRFLKVVVLAVTKSPDLLNCTIPSIWACLQDLARLGLELGPTGAWLVPVPNRKKGILEAQLWVSSQGRVEVALRSGKVRSLIARVVYECDEFEVVQGTTEEIRHRPNLWSDERTNQHIRAFYAVAVMAGGGTVFEVMTRKQVDDIKAKAKMSAYGPWVDHYVEMGRKTTVHRLSKYLPKSPEMVLIHSLDDRNDGEEERVKTDADLAVVTGEGAKGTLGRMKSAGTKALSAGAAPVAVVERAAEAVTVPA